VKLNSFELDHVNFWNISTYVIADAVVDVVILNYGSQHLDLLFKFPRFKSLCFHELFLDYAETHCSKSIEFLELYHQLTAQLPYLMNKYDIELEDMYG
jgi:hypothetical protein